MGSADQEGVLAEVRVPANSLTPYLRVRLTLCAGELRAAWWATALGFIPLHRHDVTVRLEDLRALGLRGTAFPDRLAAAATFAAVALFAPLPRWGAVLLGLGALFFLFLGYVVALHLDDGTGPRVIPVCWWHRDRVAGFIAAADAGRGSGAEA